MARAGELRELGLTELEDRLTEVRQELFNLRFQHATGQLDNYARLGQVRRDVARIATLITERVEEEAAEAEEAEAVAASPRPAGRGRRRLFGSRPGPAPGIPSETGDDAGIPAPDEAPAGGADSQDRGEPT